MFVCKTRHLVLAGGTEKVGGHGGTLSLATCLSCLVFPGLRSDTNGLDVRLDRRADVSVQVLGKLWEKRV